MFFHTSNTINENAKSGVNFQIRTLFINNHFHLFKRYIYDQSTLGVRKAVANLTFLHFFT